VTDKDFPLISKIYIYIYISLSFVAVYAIYKLHSTLFHTFLAVNKLTLRGCTQMHRHIPQASYGTQILSQSSEIKIYMLLGQTFTSNNARWPSEICWRFQWVKKTLTQENTAYHLIHTHLTIVYG